MKKLPLTVFICSFASLHAQYLDDLNSLSPTGTDADKYDWTDPTLGNITLTWSGTQIYAVRNAFEVSLGDTTTGLFGFYDANAPTLSNTSDVKGTFAWQNAVTSFEITLFDWDGGNNNPVDTITFAGVDTVEIIGRGDQIPVGYSYTSSGNTISYSRSGTSTNTPNGGEGTGLRLRLSNSDNSSFTQFSNEHTIGSDYYYIGGTAAVPEPSGALLVVFGSALGLIRRSR